MFAKSIIILPPAPNLSYTFDYKFVVFIQTKLQGVQGCPFLKISLGTEVLQGCPLNMLKQDVLMYVQYKTFIHTEDIKKIPRKLLSFIIQNGLFKFRSFFLWSSSCQVVPNTTKCTSGSSLKYVSVLEGQYFQRLIFD